MGSRRLEGECPLFRVRQLDEDPEVRILAQLGKPDLEYAQVVAAQHEFHRPWRSIASHWQVEEAMVDLDIARNRLHSAFCIALDDLIDIDMSPAARVRVCDPQDGGLAQEFDDIPRRPVETFATAGPIVGTGRVRTGLPSTSSSMQVCPACIPPPIRKFRYGRLISSGGELSVPVDASPPWNEFTNPFPRIR